MRRMTRIIILVMIIAAVAVSAVGVLGYANRGQIAEQAVVQATGNEQAASAAGKVASGQDLSDAEIRKALGLDKQTYKLVKKAAKELGIDLNDSSQLQGIVMDNIGNLDALQDLAKSVESGDVTSAEQVKAILSEKLVLPEQED